MTEQRTKPRFNERQLKRIYYRRLAVVIWLSFLMAAVETMVFFAMFDPTDLGHLATWSIDLTATQGYTLGFAFFWVFHFVTAYLVGITMFLPRRKLAKRTIPID